MRLDKPLVAVLLGALATIPQELYTGFLRFFLGIGDYSVYELNSLVITINRPNMLIGFLSTSMIGGIVSVVLYYLLNKIGYDYIVLKALVAGIISWMVSEAIFTWLLEGPKLIHIRSLSDYFVQSSGAIIFGITLGYLYRKYIVSEKQLG